MVGSAECQPEFTEHHLRPLSQRNWRSFFNEKMAKISKISEGSKDKRKIKKQTFESMFLLGRFHTVNRSKSHLRIKFKACVRYFLSNFYFSLNDSPSETMENVFLFHVKSSFCSRDIQIFTFPSSPLFLPVSHCFRG